MACSSIPWCYNVPYRSLLYKPCVSIDEGETLKKCKNTNEEFNSIFNEILNQDECFFTDGSKLPRKEFVGFSNVHYKDKTTYRYRTAGFASIFTAEAMAIEEALNKIELYDGINFSIFSDSKSVLMALLSNYGTSGILRIKTQLERLNNVGKNVKLFWIPAHKGIDGNEMADIAAKEAITNGTDSQIGIPTSDFKGWSREIMWSEFHEWCCIEGATKGTVYFEKYYKEGTQPWFRDMRIRRRSIVSLCRLRSGHTGLNQSLNRFNIVDSPMCECGTAEESANHIFWQCPKFDEIRPFLVKDLIKCGWDPPYHIVPILCNMNYNVIYAISKFINSIDKKI